MSNNLGIFINNTDSYLKYNININNFDKLKNNFDKIIVIDIETEHSINLKDKIIHDKNIYKYLLDNIFNKNIENNDFNYEKIKYVLKNINYQYFNYVTIISDNYIYSNHLNDYFNYVYNHNLDFYSFTDTTENDYNYQLYLFSFKSTYIIKIIEYFNNENDIDIIKNKFSSIFNTKMSFVKIAYLDHNYKNDIFMNDKVYEYFLENNIIKDIYFDDIESYYLYLTEENKINIGIYYAIELWLRYKTINYMDILENIPINNFERIEYGKDPFKSINNIVPIEYRSGNIKIGFCKIKNLF